MLETRILLGEAARIPGGLIAVLTNVRKVVEAGKLPTQCAVLQIGKAEEVDPIAFENLVKEEEAEAKFLKEEEKKTAEGLEKKPASQNPVSPTRKKSTRKKSTRQ